MQLIGNDCYREDVTEITVSFEPDMMHQGCWSKVGSSTHQLCPEYSSKLLLVSVKSKKELAFWWNVKIFVTSATWDHIKRNYYRYVMASLACLLALVTMVRGEMLEDGELVSSWWWWSLMVMLILLIALATMVTGQMLEDCELMS